MGGESAESVTPYIQRVQPNVLTNLPPRVAKGEHMLDIRLFAETSEKSDRPNVRVRVPEGFSIIGGGAKVDWNGSDAGQLLVASIPEDEHTWFAESKAHAVSSPATITAYAIAIANPRGEHWQVAYFRNTNGPGSRPTAVVRIEEGFVLTGGGARVVTNDEVGQLLVASFPRDSVSWEARSKDHIVSSPGTLTACAIGVKAKTSTTFPQTKIFTATSPQSDAPQITLTVDDHFIITGGGARINWHDPEPGNLLVASSPQGQNAWFVRSKDHAAVSPASITAFAVTIPA